VNKFFGRISAIILLMVVSFGAQAAVVVGDFSTNDDTQGLEFLHISYAASVDLATAEGGMDYDGSHWQLATVDQFLQLVRSATGSAVPAWNGSNLGDYDMTLQQAIDMMSALDGGDSDLVYFWLDGVTYTNVQAAAHTQGNNDFHLAQNTPYGSPRPALYVRAGTIAPVAPVPSLTQWSALVMILLLLGLAVPRLSWRN